MGVVSKYTAVVCILVLFHCRWYRGYVRQVQGNKCEVFFVDYGDTEWVDNFSLQRIDPSLLQVG